MPEDRRILDQGDIDALLRQFADSGARIADSGDIRYRMRLQQRGGVLWLAIDGVVMQPVPTEFSDRLKQVIDSGGVATALVDLRTCTYLCSSALGVLAMLLQGNRTVDGRVVLLGASEKIRRMMEIIGLGEHFVNVEREEDAARYLLLLPGGPGLARPRRP
ncbi:MAG: STAS domain-containing protein [Planctomycetes bacterium]|nr:STAS domain-containing protein [Planctomycetota bacterium]